MSKSSSYSPCDCSDDCEHLDRDDAEPCWGTVQVVDGVWYEDGDHTWIHACEGHEGACAGKPYEPEPKTDPHR